MSNGQCPTCGKGIGHFLHCPEHEEYGQYDAYARDDDLAFIRKFPDRCCAKVSRDGQSQPCDKTAVAVAYGDTDGWRCGSDSWWPVCPHHSRGRRMVPLADLIVRLT